MIVKFSTRNTEPRVCFVIACKIIYFDNDVFATAQCEFGVEFVSMYVLVIPSYSFDILRFLISA